MAADSDIMGFLTESAPDEDPADSSSDQPVSPPPPRSETAFILYHDGESYGKLLEDLAGWVHDVLVPVYVREVTSGSPWCTQWWRHPEAIARLHALFLAWQALTGARSDLHEAATWHRDHAGPAMETLRDPTGPFAGCKPDRHREKMPPPVEQMA
ncbi:DUF4913 domain-containing protein [Actinoplanes sp. NPDC051475]|uniref:DUF4913 domain-containing protein n=1 Tax=Actinoplanes sp. NPDC051475 TaxID=3157225 RepID=UPI00344E1552